MSEQTQAQRARSSRSAAAPQLLPGSQRAKVAAIWKHLGQKWKVLLPTSEKRSRTKTPQLFQRLSLHSPDVCAYTVARSHARTGSHACDVRLEFGVESQVDEGSRDLHPPPDTSHKYYRCLFEERAAQSYIASCFCSRFHL